MTLCMGISLLTSILEYARSNVYQKKIHEGAINVWRGAAQIKQDVVGDVGSAWLPACHLRSLPKALPGFIAGIRGVKQTFGLAQPIAPQLHALLRTTRFLSRYHATNQPTFQIHLLVQLQCKYDSLLLISRIN
jgi:hypothetical protein